MATQIALSRVITTDAWKSGASFNRKRDEVVFATVLEEWRKVAARRKGRGYLQSAGGGDKKRGDAGVGVEDECGQAPKGKRKTFDEHFRAHTACDSREVVSPSSSGFGGGGSRRNSQGFAASRALRDEAMNRDISGSDDEDARDRRDGAKHIITSRARKGPYDDLYHSFMCKAAHADVLNSKMNLPLACYISIFLAFLGRPRLLKLLSKPLNKSIAQALEPAGGIHILPDFLSWYSSTLHITPPSGLQNYTQLQAWAYSTDPAHDHDHCLWAKRLRDFQWWLMGEFWHLEEGTDNPLVWSWYREEARYKRGLEELMYYNPADYLGADVPRKPRPPDEREHGEGGEQVERNGDCEVEGREDCLCGDEGVRERAACESRVVGANSMKETEPESVLSHEEVPFFYFDEMERLNFGEVERKVWG